MFYRIGVWACVYVYREERDRGREKRRERERKRGEHCLDSQSEVIQKCVSISSKSMTE